MTFFFIFLTRHLHLTKSAISAGFLMMGHIRQASNQLHYCRGGVGVFFLFFFLFFGGGGGVLFLAYMYFFFHTGTQNIMQIK